MTLRRSHQSRKPPRRFGTRPLAEAALQQRFKEREVAIKVETDELKALLQSNTQLTQQNKELTEKIKALTREIHAHLTDTQT